MREIIEDLLPFILREEGSGVRKNLENILKQKNMKLHDLNVISEMSSLDAIKAAVQAGQRMSAVPYLAVKREVEEGLLHPLRIKDVNASITYDLIYFKQSVNTKIARDFIEFITEREKKDFCLSAT